MSHGDDHNYAYISDTASVRHTGTDRLDLSFCLIRGFCFIKHASSQALTSKKERRKKPGLTDKDQKKKKIIIIIIFTCFSITIAKQKNPTTTQTKKQAKTGPLAATLPWQRSVDIPRAYGVK